MIAFTTPFIQLVCCIVATDHGASRRQDPVRTTLPPQRRTNYITATTKASTTAQRAEQVSCKILNGKNIRIFRLRHVPRGTLLQALFRRRDGLDGCVPRQRFSTLVLFIPLRDKTMNELNVIRCKLVTRESARIAAYFRTRVSS